ncbi:LysM peptidoglycan-binding domain-containing protein [Phormidium tenue FACHB-886]|nr:LysM peptidoglycan-binding domain-containing protein [Phormidium tenue FACHB-886]
MSSADRSVVKAEYLKSNDSMEAIAKRFGISERTLIRWSKADPEGEWTVLRKAKTIVSAPKLQVIDGELPARENRVRRSRGTIDELEIIELAISDLSATLASGETDSRSLGSIAGALVRLLEYRRKIQPATAAELAELVLSLGISPTEFVSELKQRWQQSA